MWPLTRRTRDDYAPSRVAYRVNRMWLSPLMRTLFLWILPLLVAGGGAWLWFSQPEAQARLRHMKNEIAAQLRAQEDFQIKHIAIMGASPDLAREIRHRIDVPFPVSVLDLDVESIRATVAAFDAVASADAHVMLGGALVLTVTEREPVVLWRHAGGLAMLDVEGHRVALTDRRDGAAELPLITARGADRAVPEALALYAAAEPIADRLRGLTRQGERRWDVVLTGDTVIQLPEQGATAALQRVIGLHEAGDLLNRDVPVIDMRNPDRPTIRLGPQAFAYQRTLRAFQQGLANGG